MGLRMVGLRAGCGYGLLAFFMLLFNYLYNIMVVNVIRVV
jgi:hypothetical protein